MEYFSIMNHLFNKPVLLFFSLYINMKFCENIRILKENQKVILSNPGNGAWIKLNEEVYEIINGYVMNGGQYNNAFFDDFNNEDREYLKKIINIIQKIGIVDFISEDCITRADFAITSLCNLQCRHCCNSVMECNKEPALGEIISVLNKLHKAGIKQLCLTGGEALLRDDFSKIALTAKNLFIKLDLMTNGTLISKDNVTFLCNNFSSINISIDGYDSYSCEKIRGRGVFEKVINAVNLLHENNYNNILLSAVTNSYNDIGKFYRLCESLKVTPIVRRYAPSGRGFENEKELFIPEFSLEYQKNKELSDYILENNINYGYNKYATTVCNAFMGSVYIGSDLYIYPCGALNLPEFKCDNMMEINDIEIYFNNKMYENSFGYKKYISIKPENASYCKSCSVYIFCNNCPLYLYLYEKNGYLDKYCSECKEHMKRKIYGYN